MPVSPDAVDPGRYHATSAIRQFLIAQADQTVAPALLPKAVHERWAVKTGADRDAQALVNQPPEPGTIETLTALPVPPSLPPDGRSDGAERTVWEVRATLTGYRVESDGDFHLVIADGGGRTMIAEIPKPSDITGHSYFATQIAHARRVFDDYFHITEGASQATALAADVPPFPNLAVPVTLIGLGFFDFGHNQTGVAPNAIELHPVVDVAFA